MQQNLNDLIPLMFGGAAILHSLFLVAVLIRLSRKLDNILLSMILLLLSVRMAGCIAGLIYPKLELTGIYLGSISFSLVGPMYALYLQKLWNPSFSLNRRHYYQLLFVVPVALVLPISNVYVAFGIYQFTMLVMVVYVVGSILKFKRTIKTNRFDNVRLKWTQYLNYGVGILLMLFLSQSFFFDSFWYQAIIITSAFVLYILTFLAVRQSKLFLAEPSRSEDKELIQELGERIEKALVEDQVFTDPMLSVASLAKRLKVPPYQVSMVVNNYFNKSFPELIKTMRLKKAQELLAHQDKTNLAIEAIAYESGFSALSSFYTEFKKATNKTPSVFRKELLKSKKADQ